MFDGLGRMWLRGPGNVTRALSVECPVCHEKPGIACRVVDGTDRRGNPAKIPEVHDQRESAAYRRPKMHA
jgi:hypothetical protein